MHFLFFVCLVVWFVVKAKVYGPGGRRVRNPKPDCYYTSVVALTYSPYIIVNTV